MDSGSFGKQYKGEDIISRMPDDVLSHIISRLGAKDAVQTSVLSSRWKNVWTLIYNLCFNFTTDGNEGNRGTLFVNFVELVLRHSQSKSIQKFHLKAQYFFQESDAARLIELICWAVDHDVCSLTLKFYFEVERLPQSILTCKSLVKLSLGFSDFVLDIPDCTVCFSCLKFLSIYIYRPNSNSLQKLFRSCPILEELKIKGRHDAEGNVLTFDINMPTLKKLKVGLVIDCFDDILVHRFVVRASNLEYLEFNLFYDYLACVVVGETPFLNKVILGDDVIINSLPPEAEAKMRLTEFFRGISGTRFLSLGITHMLSIKYMYEPCPHLDGNLPFFPNLIYLDLGVDILASSLLVKFFNNSPNLEVLVLEEVKRGWHKNRFELECVPSCMLLHLKEIYLFSVESYLEGVIKCLLENSKVLERFSVHTCSRTDKQEIQNRILNFPRASPICEIEFVDYSCKEKLRSKFNKYR